MYVFMEKYGKLSLNYYEIATLSASLNKWWKNFYCNSSGGVCSHTYIDFCVNLAARQHEAKYVSLQQIYKMKRKIMKNQVWLDQYFDNYAMSVRPFCLSINSEYDLSFFE